MMRCRSLCAGQPISLSHVVDRIFTESKQHADRIHLRGRSYEVHGVGDCIGSTFQGRSTKRTTGPRIFIIIVLLCCPSSSSTSSSSSGCSPWANRCSLRLLF